MMTMEGMMDGAVLDDVIRRLLEGKGGKQVQLSETEIRQLCINARQIFLSQPTLLRLRAPIRICGVLYLEEMSYAECAGPCCLLSDYLPLIHTFNASSAYEGVCTWTISRPVERRYAYYWLTRYGIPKKSTVLRGNHEDAKINRIYGFYDECKRRFNVRLWKIFGECFNCLPVAAVIDDKILCMHGGLSPELKQLEQIKEIPRPTDIPDSGLLCDLLWSDPDPRVVGWAGSDRGVSCTFGPDEVAKFLDNNDLDLICRGHQVVEDGYEFFAKRKLVTIFSAPNYGGEFDNAGALMSVDESLVCSFEILKPAPNTSKSPLK
ncbi:hypothetical protein F511_09215 [Dorcoceras hygrometricum]|uniref:Serine/threonine-protein phosphatase n=1 Tax=Dorcoceras hygrometricum TaxID=472368 RepID=A0A2Z7CVS5_9LAMI|nr:hypothetical protein F511_09215 [Dorcoceras hygrometricum]